MSYKNQSYAAMSDSTLMQHRGEALRLRSLYDGREFAIEGEQVLVGREVEGAITLRDGHISRYHAKFSLSQGKLVLEDLKSTNGTYVNGRRITRPQLVGLGDEIRFHELAFRLVTDAPESGQADATALFSAARPVTPVPAPQPVTVPQPAAPAARQPAPRPAQDTRAKAGSLQSGSLQHTRDSRQHVERRAALTTVDLGSGPRMVILSDPLRGKVLSLISRDRNAWVVGSDYHCEFYLGDVGLGTQHARIRKLADEWVVEACDQLQPVFINNRPVEFTSLHHGDLVRLGTLELVFRTDEKSLVGDDTVIARKSPSRTQLWLLGGAIVLLGVIVGIALA